MKTMFKVALGILLFGQVACSKDSPSGIRDQRMRDAVNIHPGSYFVYADSVTGAEDSFFVTGFTHRLDSGGWERIQVALQNTASGSMTIQALGKGEKGSEKISLDLDLNGRHYPLVDLLQLEFPDPAPSGANQPYSFYGTPYRHHLSYNVLGKAYTEVYELNTQFYRAFGDSSKSLMRYFHTFFSLSDGLVKFHVADTTQELTYFLKRSSIVQK